MDIDNSIREHIRRFIMSRFPVAAQRELGDSESLLETGSVDSMGILELVAFISSEFEVEILDEELVPENFGCVDALTSFVDNKRRGRR